MEAQKPAEGILLENDWGKCKSYRIVCDCSDVDHDHRLFIEADDVGVNITVYVDVKSKFWSMNRFKQFWMLLTKGYLSLESTIVMTEQQALNYAETLKSAIQDVKDFKKP